MAIYGKKASYDDPGENIFWTTMADLLLGLAIIFMTLFVLAMTGFTQETVKMQQNQIKAAEQLVENLQKADIDAEVDKLTGNVKISDLQLFELNSYTLSSKGKAYLDKFIPIYVNTIFANEALSGGITSVVIQGHTDSQSFAGLKTKDQQFSKNMELSLKRANAVAEHSFKTSYDKEYGDKYRNMLVVEGRSFNDPIIVNGKEDYSKSRRVELKLRVKAKDFSRIFGLNFGSN